MEEITYTNTGAVVIIHEPFKEDIVLDRKSCVTAIENVKRTRSDYVTEEVYQLQLKKYVNAFATFQKKQVTCYCSAYPFPHRKHGGNCQSCRHGVNWLGVYEAAVLENGDWCPDCAYEEGYKGEQSECLTDYERNPDYRSW